ncbi:MAG: hypothetical protein DRI90_05560 [Deltaproteobacteria bacterium]|nr:MAG: hypothetical protein DRI90_05560 [Deltaproteobacteria bacterium]
MTRRPKLSLPRVLTAIGLVAGLVSNGCGIPLAGDTEMIDNACDGNADCGTGGVCRDQMCVSTKADLPGLLIQVDVPSGAPDAQSTSSLIDLAAQSVMLQGQADNGFVKTHDLITEHLVQVTGQLQIDPPPAACNLADAGFVQSAVPVTVELRPVVNAVGIPLTVYAGSSDIENEPSNAVLMSVPAGYYDVYILPAIPEVMQDGQDTNQACRDAIPPIFLPNHDFTQATVTLQIAGSEPSDLIGSFVGLDLQGWSVDLVENKRGRVISTADQNLETTSAVDPTNFALKFWPEQIESESVSAIIRLTPPEDQHELGMPTVLWHLSAVDLDGDYQVQLDLSALSVTEVIHLGAKTRDLSAGPDVGVPATVVIQSEELLDGEFGGNVSYKTTVTTDGDGAFDAWILPGTYRVVAVPSSTSDLAITEETWDINSGDLGDGRAIDIKPKASLEGSATTPQGGAAHDVSVLLQASAPESATFLQSMLRIAELQATSATTVTSGSGAFALAVDPGVLDVSLRPSSASSLPWLVRPRVTIQPSDDPQKADLGTLAISNPVVLRGLVRSAAGHELKGAQIRAWLTLPSTNGGDEQRPTAIQIAETTAGADGSYQLLLPASISQ